MKNLLIQLRDQIKDKPFLFYDGHPSHGVGLCYEARKINGAEYDPFYPAEGTEAYALLEYIKKNRPVPGSIHFDPNMEGSAWYWEHGAVAPRVAWLNDEIAKLEKLENTLPDPPAEVQIEM